MPNTEPKTDKTTPAEAAPLRGREGQGAGAGPRVSAAPSESGGEGKGAGPGAGAVGAPLLRTPLYDQHIALGAKMVPFAGYEMPVSYSSGILKEHLHTRKAAGLFDVSHMGQAYLTPADGRFETAARALEALAPGDFLSLAPGRQRYSLLLNDEGGILDDFMVTRLADEGRAHTLYLVVNAARKAHDFALLKEHLPAAVRLEEGEGRALLALQGPAAASVLGRFSPEVAEMAFMTSIELVVDGARLHVSRSGYTGEDGFELSLPAASAPALWQKLLAEPEVAPVGLGARDSLRLEAGLCLYGHDIDETTSPIEAGLGWTIGKRRREAGDFPGAERILRELAEGPPRKRVGIRPEGRAPAREGAKVLSGEGDEIGVITSGGYGPTVGGPIAMGYVESAHAAPGTAVSLLVRGRRLPARVVALPFVPHRYVRRKT